MKFPVRSRWMSLGFIAEFELPTQNESATGGFALQHLLGLRPRAFCVYSFYELF